MIKNSMKPISDRYVFIFLLHDDDGFAEAKINDVYSRTLILNLFMYSLISTHNVHYV